MVAPEKAELLMVPSWQITSFGSDIYPKLQLQLGVLFCEISLDQLNQLLPLRKSRFSSENLIEFSGLWNKHYETALKSPQVWQYWAAWSKKFVRPSRSYAEKLWQICSRKYGFAVGSNWLSWSIE